MRLIHQIQTHKTKSILIGVGSVFLLAYSLAFFIPKQVQFSYADVTCVSQLTLLPSLHRADDGGLFSVTFKDELKIGSAVWASTRTCFTPVSEPKVGQISIGTSPFGSIVAKKQFVVSVPEAPVANFASLDRPVPVSKPLIIPMSQQDIVYRYALVQNNVSANCDPARDGLSCDVPALNLKQGKEYELALTRRFKDSAAKEVGETTLETLKAVTIKKASVKDGQVVYTKPTSFSFTTDKPLAAAEVALKTETKKTQELDVTAEIDGTKLTVRWPKQLARETKYTLTLKSAEATDGSTFVEPKTYRFTMSGGPKVVAISVGANKVAPGIPVTVTFDQPIAADSAKFAKMTGIAASPVKSSDRTITLTPGASPRCQDFTVTIAKGIKSKYNIASKSDWSKPSRTLCQTVSTIGTSLQRRAIQSYSFGTSGPVTLFVGALHGNEASSSYILQDWVNYLETRGKEIPNRIVVVPTANPDGLAAGTRNNSRNVNLNRNFPTDNWEKDIDDTNGYVKGGGGSKPLSEPEAKALASLTTSLSPRLLISYHAVGSLVIGDPGGYSAAYAAKYAGLVGYQNATGGTDTFDYSITGAYEDWSYRNAGIPSMIVELGSYSYRNFNHHQAAMWEMLQ